ncbi:MAG TPA: organomercurial lyase [Thermomicrobiales bacterium]|nr:organomercurial lyase [Thermomicrobiales bacterium]
MHADEPVLWRMRYLIYQGFARTGSPPSIEVLADELSLASTRAVALLAELERRHTVLRTADGRGVLMANPFSAVPTPFRVTVDGIDSWANCAWDMLGIPAALGADAVIHATYAADNAPVELRVTDGRVEGETGIVHFLVPFRSWYEDIRHT